MAASKPGSVDLDGSSMPARSPLDQVPARTSRVPKGARWLRSSPSGEWHAQRADHPCDPRDLARDFVHVKCDGPCLSQTRDGPESGWIHAEDREARRRSRRLDAAADRTDRSNARTLSDASLG